ncbi:hypothetical protein OB236_32955 [Paenibacillus sp. WQ 127069]|uniref:Uncharacterized protein n=1 Tax=Paenibacillus baimaensis TaxID=2982185 RepID=A0ABT2UQK7_9BACL|nr:hypothetical protein [Paenibacillus sp. WQ 127069]
MNNRNIQLTLMPFSQLWSKFVAINSEINGKNRTRVRCFCKGQLDGSGNFYYSDLQYD